MRQIGSLPSQKSAEVLSDYLIAQGMTTRVDQAGEGWTLWVFNEDHVPRAREELEAFVKQPDDPRYRQARQAAEAVAREKQERDRLYRKNVRSLSGRWDGPNFRGRPLTVGLIAVSIGVYLLIRIDALGEAIDLTSLLLFNSLDPRDPAFVRSHGLAQILSGEVWRLITPIFLHGGVLHILFNMWALNTLGTLIEYRRGTAVMAALVFLSAIASNVAEFTFEWYFHPHPGFFGGMSGVVYALFGYVWMKGRFEPEQGMILHPRSISYMLAWLVFCMTGILGPIANVAHVAGLVVGVLFGLARI